MSIIEICGIAGFALNAVAADKRVNAVATTSMYDMCRVNTKGYFDSTTPEQRTALLENMSKQRFERMPKTVLLLYLLMDYQITLTTTRPNEAFIRDRSTPMVIGR